MSLIWIYGELVMYYWCDVLLFFLIISDKGFCLRDVFLGRGFICL